MVQPNACPTLADDMSLRKECYYLLLKYKCLMDWRVEYHTGAALEPAALPLGCYLLLPGHSMSRASRRGRHGGIPTLPLHLCDLQEQLGVVGRQPR